MRLVDANKMVEDLKDFYHSCYSEVQLAPYQVDRWIEQQPTVMRWNPTEEKLPEDNITVLVTLSSIDNGTFVTVAWRDNHAWKFYADDDIPADAEVVAWMELPCPAPAQNGEE